MEDIFNAFFDVLKAMLILLIVISFFYISSAEQHSYSDYEIVDCRYFLKVSGRGRTYEKMDVFYNDTKVTVYVSSVIIDTESFVRVFGDTLLNVEVHMTKEDYMNYIN